MTRRPPNYYELLGVSPDATRQEIHSAYRRLARHYHPDLNAGGDAGARFNELSGAYEVLHDPARRARYDRSRAAASRSTARQVPVFSAERPRRDVPRFLDDGPIGRGVRFGGRGGFGVGGGARFGVGGGARFGVGRRVRVQLVVRWLR